MEPAPEKRLLHDLVDLAPAHARGSAALRFKGQDFTYAELRAASERAAAGLAALGVGAGDRVALYLGNRPEVIELALACSRLGALFIPLSPLLRARQLEHVLADSGARMLVTSENLLPHALQAAAGRHALRTLLVTDEVDTAAAPAGITLLRHADLHAHGVAPRVPLHDDAPAAILYTSGSTGRSKGVVLSHSNLVSGAAIVAGYLGNTADDRLLAALPLSFDYGLSQVTTAFHVGACAVLTNFSLAATALQELAAEKITGLAGVPTMWAHLVGAEWPREVATHLRYVTNSGGAFHATLIRHLRARLPQTRLFSMYGLTEAFRSTYLDPAQLEHRPGSIGKAIPEQEILVLRPDGSRCAVDEPGELVHCGSLVTLGYWGDAAATAQRFRPLPTAAGSARAGELAVWSGDVVRADAEGFLYFVARADQLIKTSGYRVSPSEIEDVVAEVDGVRESAAVGLPDLVLGQRVGLAVAGAQRDDTLVERIRKHCRMHLPLYMVPAEIHVVDQMPYNANGKPDRAALRQRLAREG